VSATQQSPVFHVVNAWMLRRRKPYAPAGGLACDTGYVSVTSDDAFAICRENPGAITRVVPRSERHSRQALHLLCVSNATLKYQVREYL